MSLNTNKETNWIMHDLDKSGLTPDEFRIIPLTSNDQLTKYLGYTSFQGKSILELGGYFIDYPNKISHESNPITNR